MRRPDRRAHLSVRDLAVLAIERRWGSDPAALEMKLLDARRELGLDPRQYALVVNGLLDDPHARAHDAETVDRLRSARDQHRRAAVDRS